MLLAAAALAVLLVAGSFFLSAETLSPANPSWDGISSLGLGARPLYDFSELQPGSGGTLVIVGPSVNYTAGEAGLVSGFMLRGGRVVVMDDYGTANSLLRAMGSPVEIGRVPLCQDMDYYRRPALPVIEDIVDGGVTAGVRSLALNHPVALATSGDARALARTSGLGWLDPDDDGRIDGNETFGAYPVIAHYSYGNGELVVAGDADLLINGMLDRGDNGVLLSNILAGEPVYLDVAHGQRLPPLAGLYYTVKYNIGAQIICALAIVGAGCAFAARARLLKGRGKDESTQEADSRRPLLATMRKLPLSKREIEELDKKL
jgi:hypothetical protein